MLQTNLFQAKFETDTALTVSLLTNLSSLIALGLIINFVLGFWTLGGPTIAVGHLGTILLRSTHLLVGLRDKSALAIAAGTDTGAAFFSRLQFTTFVIKLSRFRT